MCRRRAQIDQIIIIIKIMVMNSAGSCLAFHAGNMAGPRMLCSKSFGKKTALVDIEALGGKRCALTWITVAFFSASSVPEHPFRKADSGSDRNLLGSTTEAIFAIGSFLCAS
jgi:hypothetical protein